MRSFLFWCFYHYTFQFRYRFIDATFIPKKKKNRFADVAVPSFLSLSFYCCHSFGYITHEIHSNTVFNSSRSFVVSFFYIFNWMITLQRYLNHTTISYAVHSLSFLQRTCRLPSYVSHKTDSNSLTLFVALAEWRDGTHTPKRKRHQQQISVKRKSVDAFRLVGQCVLLVLRATAEYTLRFYSSVAPFAARIK